MEDLNKDAIIHLIRNSNSKKEIMESTGYGIKKVNSILAALKEEGIELVPKCISCGTEIPYKAIGRSRKYCDRCSNSRPYSYKCKTCGKSFKGNRDTFYCSKECKANRDIKNHIKTCQWCNKKYKAHGKSKYCSDSCLNSATNHRKNSSLLTCSICGSQFVGSANNKHNLCSIECRDVFCKKISKEILIDLFGTTDKTKIKILIKERSKNYD